MDFLDVGIATLGTLKQPSFNSTVHYCTCLKWTLGRISKKFLYRFTLISLLLSLAEKTAGPTPGKVSYSKRSIICFSS